MQNNKKLTPSHVFAKYTNNQSRNYHEKFQGLRGLVAWGQRASKWRLFRDALFSRESLIFSKNDTLFIFIRTIL